MHLFFPTAAAAPVHPLCHPANMQEGQYTPLNRVLVCRLHKVLPRVELAEASAATVYSCSLSNC